MRFQQHLSMCWILGVRVTPGFPRELLRYVNATRELPGSVADARQSFRKRDCPPCQFFEVECVHVRWVVRRACVLTAVPKAAVRQIWEWGQVGPSGAWCEREQPSAVEPAGLALKETGLSSCPMGERK